MARMDYTVMTNWIGQMDQRRFQCVPISSRKIRSAYIPFKQSVADENVILNFKIGTFLWQFSSDPVHSKVAKF